MPEKVLESIPFSRFLQPATVQTLHWYAGCLGFDIEWIIIMQRRSRLQEKIENTMIPEVT